MAIKYEAFTRQGEKVKGVLDTDSEDAAYSLLEQEELTPYRLMAVRRGKTFVQRFPGLFTPNPRDIIDFTRSLSALLTSGISLRRALMVQRDEARSPGLKEAMRQVISDIEAGARFSDAMAKHRSVFAEFYIRMIKVGEVTGTISASLAQIAANLLRRKSVTDKVKKALVYPAITLVVAMIASFVLITYSLPALTKLLKEFGGQLPLATRILLAVADVFQTNSLAFILAFLVVAMIAVLAARSKPGIRIRDITLLQVPVVGRIIVSSNMFFLTSTMGTLMRAGVAPVEAMRLTGDGLPNTHLRKELASVIEETAGGTRIGQAFANRKAFPNILSQSLSTGEMRGNLGDTLASLADYYQDQTERSVSSTTELIQPLVIMFVAGVVGFVAIAVISGIYSTLGSISTS
ncbi:MAG: type II secretion system F family protein [SAR202 cluster bacterium]|nr:type II secretion system F family protein [SAR202 cluster bacterium]